MRQNMQLMTMERDRELGFADGDVMEPIHGAGHNNVLHRLHVLLRGRYKWAILLAIIGAAGGAVLGWRAGKKEYQSMGQIHVMPVLPKLIYETGEKGIMPMFDQFVETQT